MSVTNEDNKVSYVADGGATYDIPFYFEDDTHIKLYIDDVQKTISTHYTVSGEGNLSGGEVTIITPPLAPSVVTIIREVPLKQENTFNEGGPFQAKTMEKMFDKLTHLAQQINEKADRSIKVPVSSTVNPELSGEVIPGGMLVFDEDGENIIVGPDYVTYFSAVEAFSDSAVDAAVATAADVITAEASKNAAATSATNAATSATASATSAAASASSATSASGSASTATTQAGNASTSATAAASSATTASTHATTSTTQAGIATTQAGNAATSATAAAGSATTASTQATNASGSATAAATSATNAGTSATNAAASATAAAASATSIGLTTKGDLLSHNGTASGRLPVGTNNHVLVADSSQTLGVKWGANTPADLTVTTAKIVDANVTAAKLATDSVTTLKLIDEAVTNAKVSNGAGIKMSKTNFGVAFIKDVKSNGTVGGASVVGEQVRTLNTLEDADNIVTSLSSNLFTLPAGTYVIEADVPSYRVARHKAYLYNNTDSVIAIMGSNGYSGSGADYANSVSRIQGVVSIASAKAFKINHYTSTVNSSGLGLDSATSTYSEIYTSVKITRIK